MKPQLLIIDFGSTKVPDIKAMIESCAAGADVCAWNAIPTALSSYHGIVLSGAPILLTQVDASPYVTVIEKLLHANIPILGICFGHQLIGLHFGARVELCQPDRDLQTIHLQGMDLLFEQFGIWESFMEDHTESITLPPTFICLGRSSVCEVEAMRHPTLPVYGVQFHPEVSGENGRKVFMNFIKICKG